MRSLIFDFDGVLGDTYEASIGARMQINNIPTREEAVADLLNYFTKKPNHTRDHNLSEEQLKRSYEWVSEFGGLLHDKGFPLFSDFISVLETLNNVQMAVVSSGSQHYVLPALAETNLDFTHILAYEDHHSKEEKIDIVCKDWGVATKDVFYFTDTLADVYELKNFIHKDRLIGVAWGYCSVEQLRTELSENNILYNPADIHKLLAH